MDADPSLPAGQPGCCTGTVCGPFYPLPWVKGEMVAEIPRCSQSLGLSALFFLLLCRETPAARAAMQSSCGESFDTPLHPHALWVLKPVFQALHFFSEDTPVRPDASGKEAPDVIVAGSGKGGEWPGSIHQIRS